MKYENVEKAMSLKKAIDQVQAEIDYFKNLYENEYGVVIISDSDRSYPTPMGALSCCGEIKESICEIVLNDLREKLERMEDELDNID